MTDLVAVAIPGGPEFVSTLERVWADGHAVLPVDPRLPPLARDALLEAMAPARIVEPDGSTHELPDSRPLVDGDAVVVATSGSTGTPKGVVHTHASLEASARLTSAALGVDPERDAWLCPLPVSHIAGFAVVMRARTLGMPVEILPRFDATVVEEAARDRGATLTALVPTALRRVDAGLFRKILVGSSAVPKDRPANTVATYAMTETGSSVVFEGQVITGIDLRVVEDEIQVRGPVLLRAYRDGTDPRMPDGWYPTGDAGVLDEDNRLTVFGRQGDLIITGGENVWPGPVEDILATLASVREVAVVGRPDNDWVTAVTAVVVPTDPANPPTLDELRAAVKERMLPAHAPRGVEYVDALPRTPLGKVRRADL